MDVIHWLQSFQGPLLTAFFKGITALGNEGFYLVAMPLLYWCWKKEEARRLIFLLLPAYFVGTLTKDLTQIARPAGVALVAASGFSFPSGHALSSTVFWGFFAVTLRRRWFTVLAVALIALISLSRLSLGAHWPTDVAGGVAIGCAALFLFRALEPLVVPALRRMPPGTQAMLLLLLTAIPAAFSPGMREVLLAGLLMGMGGGVIVDARFLNARRTDDMMKTAAAVLAGLAGGVLLWLGGERIFPGMPSLRYLQCAIIGFWMTAGAPWLFLRLRLFRKEVA